MTLTLANSLTRTVDAFTPIDPSHIRMYVCGPTVYARPHIGNARSVVVYDVLFRLLQQDFPQVTYARNITDVDDKINAAAMERGISIQALTEEVTAQFHADMDTLHCLRPTVEPRATTHIPQMIALIESLIEKGFAYEAEGHVLFAVQNDPHYGHLSRRSVEDMVAGARVEVAPYKRYAGDFVLWKPASEKDDASSKFDSPWGVGRPGWHIECSAMSATHLGTDFDIHGGGADLMFPHHENECAQSRCGHTGSGYARYWVHNGFLTVDGEKMSKSLGNFTTVHDLLTRGVKGEAIRWALLSTRYNEPLDWTEKLLADANKVLDRLYRVVSGESSVVSGGAGLQSSPLGGEPNPSSDLVGGHPLTTDDSRLSTEILSSLRDNLNTPKALAILQTLEGAELIASARFLGFLTQSPEQWFKGNGDNAEEIAAIEAQIAARAEAKKARDFARADAIREALKAEGILLEDTPQGTSWRRE